MDKEEIWKDIKGWEGLYQVSNLGRVRSLPKGGHKETITMNCGHDSCGYFQAKLSAKGVQKSYKVHRLVALAFIPNPKKYKEINHKDENKENNEVTNLEWCDRSYNLNYGSYPSNMRLKMTNRKDKSKHVCQYTKDGKYIRDWVSSKEVERQCGYNRSNICACCRGTRRYAYGFVWKFKD